MNLRGGSLLFPRKKIPVARVARHGERSKAGRSTDIASPGWRGWCPVFLKTGSGGVGDIWLGIPGGEGSENSSKDHDPGKGEGVINAYGKNRGEDAHHPLTTIIGVKRKDQNFVPRYGCLSMMISLRKRLKVTSMSYGREKNMPKTEQKIDRAAFPKKRL